MTEQRLVMWAVAIMLLLAGIGCLYCTVDIVRALLNGDL